MDEALASIFSIAEEGVTNFGCYVNSAGHYELMMFDIWYGTTLLQKEFGYNIVSMDIQSRIESFLKKKAARLGLSEEKKYERLYLFRQDGWEKDIRGLVNSDYPRTKQYLPVYMFLCIIHKPLIVYDDEMSREIVFKENTGEIIEFLTPFCDHCVWLAKKLKKVL